MKQNVGNELGITLLGNVSEAVNSRYGLTYLPSNFLSADGSLLMKRCRKGFLVLIPWTFGV